jgi:hypothetical protein
VALAATLIPHKIPGDLAFRNESPTDVTVLTQSARQAVSSAKPPPNSGVHNHASTQPGQTMGCLPRSARSRGESYQPRDSHLRADALPDLADVRASHRPHVDHISFAQTFWLFLADLTAVLSAGWI